MVFFMISLLPVPVSSPIFVTGWCREEATEHLDCQTDGVYLFTCKNCLFTVEAVHSTYAVQTRALIQYKDAILQV